MTLVAGFSDPDRVAARAAALGARPFARSRDGRALVAIELGATPTETTPTPPTTPPTTPPPVSLVLAGIHPLEWIGVEVALTLAERVAAAPPVDRRVVIVPVVNVDGHAAVAADLAAGRRRSRRTNRAGVDLNRNFAVGHQPRPRHGPAPWSEPEVQAIADLVAGLDGGRGAGAPAKVDRAVAPAKVDRAVALHAFGRMILLPWAHRGATSPRHPELVAHARALAARLPGRYRVLHTGRWPLFRPGGLELDWLTERGALAMLVECGRGGLAARRPSTWLTPFRWYNPAAPGDEVQALARGLEPFVRGAPAPDATGS